MQTLHDSILNACRGYEREHVLKTLQDILDSNNPDVCRNRFGMEPCPVCGNKDVHITNVMRGVTSYTPPSQPRVVSKMGVCIKCNFKGPVIRLEDMPTSYTEASWTMAAVKAWNDVGNLNVFKILDRTYGKQYQYDLFHEETIELIEALFRTCLVETRFQRGDRHITNSDVVSEMADVIILIYQWLHSSGIRTVNLDIAMKAKLDRICSTDAVRTAIAELSRKVMVAATSTSARTAGEDSTSPT